MSYIAQPPDASMLYSLEIPKFGGDTWFCGMKAALAKMPNSLFERIKGLDIKHDGTYDSGGYVRKGMTPSKDPRTSVGTPHPMVIRHPVSGDAALYLGRRLNAYVVGMEVEESERLLDEVWSCRSRRVQAPLGPGRSRALGQPHHHAPARRLRSQIAPRNAPHPDQGLGRAGARRSVAAVIRA
jgi:taurine dioxygenase